MRIRHLIATTAVASLALVAIAGPAAADPNNGKKYDVDLTREAAIEAGDIFGVAPAGSFGEGTVSLNHGQRDFCLDLDFDLPDGVSIVAIHLHEKEEGAQNGPVVIDAGDLIAADGQSTDGCVEGDREFLRGVLTEPEEYYVNAHTNVNDPDSVLPVDGLSVVRTEFGRN